jgi:hypothetical protein
MNWGVWLLLVQACSYRVQAQTSDHPLKGVSKLTVHVQLAAEEIPPSVSRDRLRTITELKLRTAGIKVLSEDEDRRDSDINPAVEVSVILLAARAGGTDLGHAFSTRLSVRDYRLSRRNTAIVPSELWANSFLDLVPTNDTATQLERTLNMLLDQLLNEWLKANPKS